MTALLAAAFIAVVIAVIGGSSTWGLLAGALFVTLFFLAFVTDMHGGWLAHTTMIRREEIQSVVAQLPQPRISRGKFVIHCRSGAQYPVLEISVPGGDEPDGEFAKLAELLRQQGMLGGTCRGCGYGLMPEQKRCPECGKVWAG